MADLLKTLTLLAAAALAGTAGAQTATTEAEQPADQPAEQPADQPTAEAPAADAVGPNGLAMGAEADAPPANGVGSTYTAETHGSWEMRCVRTAEGKDPCQLYQLLKDSAGNSVAEISIFGLPAGQQAAAGATVITPLETLLTEQMTLTVDTGKAKRYPYTFCAPAGCFARIGFTGDDVSAFKRGAKATLTIVPAAAPDEKVDLDVSLSGFTAGYDAVNKANVASSQ